MLFINGMQLVLLSETDMFKHKANQALISLAKTVAVKYIFFFHKLTFEDP